MDSYAVVWIDEDGTIRVGKLELTAEGLRLTGTLPQDVPYDAILRLHLGRRQSERISGRTALVLDLADGRRVRIGSVGAPGTLHELAERLSAVATEKLSA